MLLEYINAAACLILMGFSLPVAMTIGNRGLWFHRLSLVAVQIGLFMQMTNPFIGWLPQITWTSVYLNAASAVLLIIWWRRAWLFIRSYLGPIDFEKRRRREDLPTPETVPPSGIVRYPWSGPPRA